MIAIDVALRRLLRCIRDALPGHTTASQLMRQSGHWKHVPPQQQASAYAQYLQTRRQLRQHHIQLKILPKIVDLLFVGLRHHLAAPLGQLLLLCILACLFSLC